MKGQKFFGLSSFRKKSEQESRAVSTRLLPLINPKATTKKRTPTEIISREDSEVVWTKKPRGNLVRRSSFWTEGYNYVNSPMSVRGDTMRIHIHLPNSNLLSMLPSSTDLNTLFKSRKFTRVSVIAGKDSRKVAGYTFIKRRKGLLNFFKQFLFSERRETLSQNPKKFLEKYPALSNYRNNVINDRYIRKDGSIDYEKYSADFNAAKKDIESAGFVIKFVPNKGYYWDGSRFVKKN